MKVLAKQAMKSSAESRGVSWDKHVQAMYSNKEVLALKEEFERSAVQYPDYYLKPFHAYDEGNLNWLAAFEVEPATYAMAIRTFKNEKSLTPEQAATKLRTGVTDSIKAYYKQHSLAAPNTIIDMGCSTGISTRWLAKEYPNADITGMDLSPHFLAVAEWEERRNPTSPKRIKYVRGLAEATGLPAASVDMLVFNFVIHECPQAAITDFITEGRRVVRPGGTLIFVDNNPKSKTIQNLPPPIFTLMKSTEPHSDEYYSFDVEAAMRAAGFREVVTTEADHRHRVVLGVAA
eukprot:CAMPEP_0202889622 /NCGR_PEP_ID=MMETSP1392-20130828/210_1 /ASSEMBLY_ACC=CAM_ASM_000868 /TAXON_ID=225041 /ORGANISM="Chlamydomonas chlamydogama, Strain SAG 11-48b" /LENGTH=289 /DNA_ID=CAMNT_0049572999 /DNA_START=240 /DNA_END=1109 /DNA_ORIENTATION=-